MKEKIKIILSYYTHVIRFLSIILIVFGILFACLGAWSINKANRTSVEVIRKVHVLYDYRTKNESLSFVPTPQDIAGVEFEISKLEAQADYFSTGGSLFLGLAGIFFGVSAIIISTFKKPLR
jgi:hypothetical protein